MLPQAGQVKKLLFSSFFKLAIPVLIFVVPAVTHAGFFDVLNSFFSKIKEVHLDQRPVNSQTMQLLQGAVSSDPNPAKGGGDIAVVGGVALLSEDGPSGTIADVQDNTTSGHISIYVVRSGDSLSSIAKLFGVSVNTVVWANDIKGGVISPGQTLVILPVSGVEHTVVKGDTIQSIAKKYKADATEIAQFNDLTQDSSLAIGEVIIIPDGEIAAPTSGANTPTSRVHGAGGPVLVGYYLRPLIGGHKTQGLHGYNAIDLGAPIGTPVFASAEGTVIVSKNYGWNGGYGSYIVISHPNGTQTLYAHLSKNLVFEGYGVVKGQVIGEVGRTGKATGPHLHFEIRGAANPF